MDGSCRVRQWQWCGYGWFGWGWLLAFQQQFLWGGCGQQFYMLKPKTHSFRVKVLLSKLEAVSNKVASRCHAALRIDNEDLVFNAAPELRKNVASFNAEVQAESVGVQLDEVTGLYEGKTATVVFQLETQGTRVKIGEVVLNLGAILNEKKYRIVNSFPLAKCYDKTAKAKISVDFVPLNAPIQHPPTPSKSTAVIREVRQVRQASQVGVGAGWRGFRSRLAEESNVILQEKIYEYEQKLDNYRLSQTQLQEKLHEQITSKDDQIADLTAELARKNSQLSSMAVEGEQLRYRIKQLGEEVGSGKEGSRALVAMVQGLQGEEQELRKQVQALRGSLQNQGRTKESKEKHYAAELAKYTQRYLESEQERNKIVFQLETKFKEETEKKDANYRALMAATEKKHTDALTALRASNRQLEGQLADRSETIDHQAIEIKKLSQHLQIRSNQMGELRRQLQAAGGEKQTLQVSLGHLQHELQTLTFSYAELEREAGGLREEASGGRRTGEQLRMELVLANQTIDEQRKTLAKLGKEVQVHQERAYYLAERINDDLEVKSQQEENLRGKAHYYREEVHRLNSQLRLAEERAEEEATTAHRLADALTRMEAELSARSQALVRGGEERVALETESRALREDLGELEEALLVLREENAQLGECLREKRTALENDKSLEWSYKIEELQADISEMVEKFKVQKDLLRDAHRKEESKRKEEISALSQMLKAANSENDELRRAMARREAQGKDHDSSGEHLRIALREKAEEVAECREKMRIYAAEVEELESRLAGSEERQASRLREVEEQHQRELKSVRKADTLRLSFNKAISQIVDCISKPYSTALIFQEVVNAELDAEITAMLNLSLKKHCEERTKIRETIKRLEGQSFFRAEKESFRPQQKRIISEIELPTPQGKRYFKEEVDSPWKYGSMRPKDSGEMDSLRDQNQRLKRELSELRVRMKGLEDDVGKAERNCQSERYAREASRHELEDLQEELERISFQLKRKEKIIVEYQSEMKEMQTEILSTKNLQTTTAPKQLSRAELRQREKEESAQNSRNAILVRDLQGRLQQKNKEFEELSGEAGRLKSEVASLNEALAVQRSESKAAQGRLRQKTAKVASLQEQLSALRDSIEDEKQREALRLQKRIADLEEQSNGLEEENRRLQQALTTAEREAGQLQRRVKQTREDGRAVEGRMRREGEEVQGRLKETIQQLEHSLLALQSDLDQLSLRNKEAANRAASLTALLARKTEEADRQATALTAAIADSVQLRQRSEEELRASESRVGALVQRVEELQGELQEKDYELEEYRFTAEGRLMDLEKRLEEAVTATPPPGRRLPA